MEKKKNEKITIEIKLKDNKEKKGDKNGRK